MYRIIYSLILILFLVGCDSDPTVELKPGDLIFIGNSASQLSAAIDKVTKTSSNTSFSHMGILEIIEGEYFVLHSNSNKGVCREKLDSFKVLNATEKDSIYVFRLIRTFSKSISPALHLANMELGQPYNNTYILEDEGYYCSEYIYHLFAQDSVFKLNPMTFKDPETGNFNETWINYYAELGIPIPEGKLGCNPNEMAESDNILFITKF